MLSQADLSQATLFGATLHNTNLHDAKLTDSFLVEVKAPGADLSHGDMRGCYLIGADLKGADLSHARLQGADLSKATLTGATLCDAKLTEVDLTGAQLDGVNWYGAWVVGSYLTRHQIGSAIVQERESYQGPDPRPEDAAIPGRFAQAASVYRVLKNNFLSIGSYDDASWAYVKERVMRKKTHWPARARESYPLEFEALKAEGVLGRWSRLAFFTRHSASWALDWIFELTSAYGERPLRALAWAGALVLGFSLLFGWIGGIDNARSGWDYFNYSLGSFVTMSFNDLGAVSAPARILTSIEALLGICLLALLMFALGNRINRS
jgi:hypothetical protein